MKVSVNKCVIAGNLVRDIEVKNIPSGMAVGEGTLAINETRKGEEMTVYVDFTLWGKQAEAAGQYVGKGSAVLIEGRLKLDRWENKDGQKRSKLSVNGDRIQFLDSRDSQPDQGQGAAPAAEAGQGADSGEDDNMPF